MAELHIDRFFTAVRGCLLIKKTCPNPATKKAAMEHLAAAMAIHAVMFEMTEEDVETALSWFGDFIDRLRSRNEDA